AGGKYAMAHAKSAQADSKTRFLRTLHFWVGVWGGEAAPNPHHWGGAEGAKAPPHLPHCKADRCQAEPCLSSHLTSLHLHLWRAKRGCGAQRHADGRAIWPAMLQPDPPAQRLHTPPRNAQPKAGAGCGRERAGAAAPIKRLEDALALVVGDARPFVADADHRQAVAERRRQRDRAGPTVAHCIVHHLVQRPAQAGRVAPGRQPGWDVGQEAYAFGLGDRRIPVYDLLQQGGELDRGDAPMLSFPWRREMQIELQYAVDQRLELGYAGTRYLRERWRYVGLA